MNKKESKKNAMRTVEKENILQAVVIVDSFHKNFLPVSSCPALLPVANRKLLHYCLEWLNMSGVNEVLVLCSSHVDEIRQHLQDMFFLNIEVKVLFSEKCYSFGDVMRALDGYAVIRNTFILLSVDVIGNVNFLPLVDKLKMLQQTDKELCMMLLLKEVGNQRDDLLNDTIIAYNGEKRLIHYQVKPSKQVKLPMDVILEQEIVEIRHDLMNPGVAICTAEIPLLFSENFDCQTLNDLILGLLVNEEISLKTVHCEVLSDGQYFAKAENWPMYQSISRDIIRRWSYPLVPDMSERYSYRKNSIYLKNVTFSKDCKLGFDVVIGNKTKLNKGVCIDKSIIGSDCQIGERVVIENSFIFDGVRIDSGSIVRHSVIGEKCHVKKNCVLKKNCLLGPGVVLKENSELENASLVSDKHPGIERLSKYSDACFHYRVDVENSDSEDEEVVPALQVESFFNKGHLIVDDEESSESDSEEGVVPVDDVKIFYGEVIDSLKRGYKDKLNCENLILEINSSRYAYNITVNEVNYNLMRAILNIGLEEIEKNVKTVLQYTVSKLKYFLPLMKNYFKNETAQRDCLSAIEDVMEESTSVQNIASKILQFLYDKEILSEELIVNWYENLVANGMEELAIRLVPFIEWLKEAEEESDDD